MGPVVPPKQNEGQACSNADAPTQRHASKESVQATLGRSANFTTGGTLVPAVPTLLLVAANVAHAVRTLQGRRTCRYTHIVRNSAAESSRAVHRQAWLACFPRPYGHCQKLTTTTLPPRPCRRWRRSLPARGCPGLRRSCRGKPPFADPPGAGWAVLRDRLRALGWRSLRGEGAGRLPEQLDHIGVRRIHCGEGRARVLRQVEVVPVGPPRIRVEHAVHVAELDPLPRERGGADRIRSHSRSAFTAVARRARAAVGCALEVSSRNA